LIPAPYRHESVIVEGLPLAQILSDEEVATTRIIKIDVEGAEGSVLEGIWPLISRMPKDVEIVVEVSPLDLGANAVREIFASFEKEGFFTYSLYNSYNPEYYLYSAKAYEPQRLSSLPAAKMDLVFSRVDAPYLGEPPLELNRT
jgi:hypothetical protein